MTHLGYVYTAEKKKKKTCISESQSPGQLTETHGAHTERLQTAVWKSRLGLAPGP